ncbi:hypothetical protein GCM10008015_08860 [Flavobacterium palustre]|uniref:DUF6377 domain-containing protein n=1 Tax=Flavobacterium palustre TaxID=1476463 RepID=A0ABQ1HBZ0_9FLAO|nr:DUF6377 domain-containing protein [Flavobacterium palustre]GGA70276.1 hypothetical protein GCM10008015_08860 [Flavobacterium palustre]
MFKFWTSILIVFSPIFLFSQTGIDSLLEELDATIDKSEFYHSKKEAEINKLRSLLKLTSTEVHKYEIYEKLFTEFKFYQSDSALNYARKSLAVANTLKDLTKINTAKINLASIMGTLGMYKEATDILYRFDIKSTPEIKSLYYGVNSSIYLNMAEYAASNQEKRRYDELTMKYRDSTFQSDSVGSNSYFITQANKLFEKEKYDETIKLLENYFSKMDDNNTDKAVVAYIISQTYFRKKDFEQEKKWLILSAISDLQLEKKEYISLRSLAFMMYKEGDIDRAYKYIKRSLDDALFCNARLRTYEISKMMPIINDAYQKQNDTNRNQLITFLVSASILSLFLMVVLFLLFKQMKKLSKAKQEISSTNAQLVALNNELHLFNEKLNATNNTLKEANLVKEIYIGRYMDQCSVYISKLDEYRRKLNVIVSSGKTAELVKVIKSKEFIEEELKEFYHNFDKTFLLLFPNFIEDFNNLLVDNEDIKLKQGELMNTELRIFALIRLGISDSVKIAEFLRYSLSTIYNYRTKLRNKALGPRDEFEANVMRIESTNK